MIKVKLLVSKLQKRLIKQSLILFPLLLLASCFFDTTKEGEVGIKRSQFMTVSSGQMQQAANTSYTKILQKAKSEGKLNTKPELLKRIRQIGTNLKSHVAIFRKDALNWDWQINLIESEQLNAWCMPGGKIAFYTGIIEKLQLTDAEIAAIMGHEIAHALREHGRERASQAQLKNIGLKALQMAGVTNSNLQLTDVVTNLTLTLPNSRTHETEADRLGVELAARAGYNPYAAVQVWEKMSKVSKNSPPEILSTHPSNSSRIKDLKKYSQKVNHIYLKTKK